MAHTQPQLHVQWQNKATRAKATEVRQRERNRVGRFVQGNIQYFANSVLHTHRRRQTHLLVRLCWLASINEIQAINIDNHHKMNGKMQMTCECTHRTRTDGYVNSVFEFQSQSRHGFVDSTAATPCDNFIKIINYSFYSQLDDDVFFPVYAIRMRMFYCDSRCFLMDYINIFVCPSAWVCAVWSKWSFNHQIIDQNLKPKTPKKSLKKDFWSAFDDDWSVVKKRFGIKHIEHKQLIIGLFRA